MMCFRTSLCVLSRDATKSHTARYLICFETLPTMTLVQNRKPSISFRRANVLLWIGSIVPLTYRSAIFRITGGLTLHKPLTRHNGLSGCQTLPRRVLDSKLN